MHARLLLFPKGFLQALISLVFVFLKLKLTIHITRRGLVIFSRTCNAESNPNEKFANWTRENFEDFILPILSKTDAINRTVRD